MGNMLLNKYLIALILLPMLSAASSINDLKLVQIPAGSFHSVVPPGEEDKDLSVATFFMQTTPVSNAEFLNFVINHPQWRRDNVSSLFADQGYLIHWASAETLGKKAQPNNPVTHVSWFAATAYCEAKGLRLPDWYEWEYAAAADEKRKDARNDPQWRQKILNWYATTGNTSLADRGLGTANFYGIYDLQGLIWEWVQDYSALLVGTDNREQGGADKFKFCGAGALSMQQKEQYAVLMRVAMLSSLQASYTTANLGFRCARDDTPKDHK